MFVAEENSSLGPGSALGKKEKIIDVGERSEPRGSLGRGKASPFPLPRPPVGSLRSPIFFPFDTVFLPFFHCDA